MQECKVCRKEFDFELSKKSVIELREIRYDHNFITDARDEGFCSKWCEKKWHDENDVDNFKAGLAQVMTPKPVMSPTLGREVSSRKVLNRELKRRGIVNTNDLDTPIKQMERDKTMVSMIKNGKAGDRGLKAEAIAISREYEDKRKKTVKEKDHKELFQMKKKYGLLPEQLKRRANA